jgi:hypothetical protein
MNPCVDFIAKSSEILGNAFALEMECANNYEGRIRALPGLSRPHPCGTLFQTVAVPVRRKE